VIRIAPLQDHFVRRFAEGVVRRLLINEKVDLSRLVADATGDVDVVGSQSEKLVDPSRRGLDIDPAPPALVKKIGIREALGMMRPDIDVESAFLPLQQGDQDPIFAILRVAVLLVWVTCAAGTMTDHPTDDGT
jgi:hypothetical protein